MILIGTLLKVIDNSGARIVRCIGFSKIGRRRFGLAGDIIKVSVRSIRTDKKIVKGAVYRAVIVRVKKGRKRDSGDIIVFDENAVVLLKNDNTPLGTRILGAVMSELRLKKLMKVVSLSKVTI